MLCFSVSYMHSQLHLSANLCGGKAAEQPLTKSTGRSRTKHGTAAPRRFAPGAARNTERPPLRGLRWIENMKNGELKRQFQSFIFFIGWVLSPFTTWNDVFVNIPLSYLIANFVYIFIRPPFRWLFIGSYIFTNVMGLVIMFFSGKEYVLSTKSKIKAAFSLVLNTAVFSAIIYLLDKSRILAPFISNYLN